MDVIELKEMREKHVSARIKPRAKRIIENSKYSYADAIEYFAFEVLNKTEDKKLRLKNLKIQNQKMDYEICRNNMEIKDLAEELGINPNDDLLFADEIKKSVRAVIQWYKREKESYGTIENFFDLKKKKIKPYATECNLDMNEFEERVISEYYSQENQKKLNDFGK